MTLYTPLWMQAAEGDTLITYPGLLLRLGITGTWASEGVTSAANFKVSQRDAGANMSVDVAGGIAVVTGNDVNLQGTYMCISDAVENVTVPAAPASGSRTHRIILWVKDKLYDGSLPADTYEFTVELQEDTGSGTPAQPDSAISLATVTVASGQVSVTDSNITDTRVSALTTPSWIRQVGSAADRPAVPLAGEEIWRTDLAYKEIYDGSSWRPLGLNPPTARLGRTSTNQSILNSTSTALAWNTESEDTHGGHDNSTNNSRYTAPIAGLYLVTVTVPWVQATGGIREVNLRVDGTTSYAGSRAINDQNITYVQNVSRLIRMSAGSYVEAVVQQSSGASLAIDRTFGGGPSMEICWMRA